MSNSGGADGLGVSGLQSLWISLPITHLAPVAISPRALWWRRPPWRPLGAGAFAFFFPRASSATYLSGSRTRPGGRRLLGSPVPPGFRSWDVSPLPLLILANPSPGSPPPLPPAPPPTSHPNVGRSRRRLFPGYRFHSCLGLR